MLRFPAGRLIVRTRPAASLEFIKARRFDPRLAPGLAIGGIRAVLVAALIVKEMPLDILRWLVSIVVPIAAGMLFSSGIKGPQETGEPKET